MILVTNVNNTCYGLGLCRARRHRAVGPDRSCGNSFGKISKNSNSGNCRQNRSKISRCWVKSMPDTWISLFLTHSAGYTAQDEIHVTEISLGFTVDRHDLEEHRDTCVETRVEKPTLRRFMKRTGLYENWKIHVFRSKISRLLMRQARQNIEDFAATFCGKISRRAEQNLSGPTVQTCSTSRDKPRHKRTRSAADMSTRDACLLAELS